MPVPPVVPSICTSRGRLAPIIHDMLQWRPSFSASLNGGMPSSGVRLGDIGVGDLGDFGFIDTRRNASKSSDFQNPAYRRDDHEPSKTHSTGRPGKPFIVLSTANITHGPGDAVVQLSQGSEGETSGPDVGVAGRLLGVELPYDRM